jgi:probable phosphoglycerate mutase
MDIILVRHGETEWNVGEVFRGRADIDLNENGRKQAVLLGEYLKDTGIKAVYASPPETGAGHCQSYCKPS